MPTDYKHKPLFMKKHFLLFLFLCLFTSVKAQEEYFNCEFIYSNLQDNGNFLGGQFITYDLDGLTPIAQMQEAGFAVGTPWVVLRASQNDFNYFVGSMSLYEPEGTSNDWLILPRAFKLKGKGVKLSWKSKVFDNTDPEKRGGYKVMISTKGTAVEDFETKPIFSIDKEEASDWQQHTVKLDEYAGHTVYIAFVNNSTNKDVLGIDDIVITGPKSFAQFMSTAPVYTPEGEVTVGGRVLCAGADPITSLKISYELDGHTYSKEYNNLNLKSGEIMDVAVDEKIVLAQVGDHKPYKVWLEANNEPFTYENYEVTRTAFKPTQRVLLEEPTGYWCANCTQGLVFIELLKEKYKELFIPVAVHGPTYSRDRMTNTYYSESLSSAIGNSNYPYGFVNRTYSNLPVTVLNDSTYTSLLGREGDGGFEYLVEKAFNDGTYADIDLTAFYLDPDAETPTLSFEITSKFALDVPEADYRFAVALVENRVNNKIYKQQNILSSFPDNWYLFTSQGLGEAGTFLGYEKKPSVIPGLEMVYNDVARLIIGEFKGIANSVNKSSIQVNEEIKYQGEFNLGEFEQKIGKYNNIEVVAMLVEQETGKVVNSAKFSLYDPDRDDSIETMEQAMGVQVYAADGQCRVQVSLDQPEEITIGIYSIDGKLVKTVKQEMAEGAQSFTIGGLAEQGIYVVKVAAGDKVVTKKIAL